MTLPPCIMRVRVFSLRRQFGLWFPLFILCPSCKSAPSHCGREVGAALLAGPLLFALLFALRGLTVEVGNPSEQILISFN
jgi:hypothetical protein